MPSMRCSLVLLGALAACVPSPQLPSFLDTEGDEESAASSGMVADAEGDSPSPGTSSEDGNDSGDPDSADDASTSGDCDVAGCAVEPPALVWSVESDEIYGDGRCLGVADDGLGGLFASYVGYGFEAYSDVIAVDAAGSITALAGGTETGMYVGLASRGPGIFDWAAANGHVGIADQTLQNLDGGLLTYDVDQIRAMAAADAALHYVARISPSYRCVVRTGPDQQTDSVPFDCAPDFSPERLVLDTMGNRYYVEPRAYRVLRLDAAGLSYGSIESRWNRVGFDAAVDPQGHVWIAGGTGSGSGDLFGAFVAQHEFDLAEEPRWEETDDTGLLWTAIAMTPTGPVVFGHRGFGEELHARGYGLDGGVAWTWSQESSPQTYVDAVAVDAKGDLLVCGTRYSGVQTPVGNDVHYPTLLKFER